MSAGVAGPPILGWRGGAGHRPDPQSVPADACFEVGVDRAGATGRGSAPALRLEQPGAGGRDALAAVKDALSVYGAEPEITGAAARLGADGVLRAYAGPADRESGSCRTPAPRTRVGVGGGPGPGDAVRWTLDAASARHRRRGHARLAIHARKISSRARAPGAVARARCSRLALQYRCEERNGFTARHAGRRTASQKRLPGAERGAAAGAGAALLEPAPAGGAEHRVRLRTRPAGGAAGAPGGAEVAAERRARTLAAIMASTHHRRPRGAPPLSARSASSAAPVYLRLEELVVLVRQLAGLPVELDLLERRQGHALGRLLRIERLVTGAAVAPGATSGWSTSHTAASPTSAAAMTSSAISPPPRPAPGAVAPAPPGWPRRRRRRLRRAGAAAATGAAPIDAITSASARATVIATPGTR